MLDGLRSRTHKVEDKAASGCSLPATVICVCSAGATNAIVRGGTAMAKQWGGSQAMGERPGKVKERPESAALKGVGREAGRPGKVLL